MKKLITLLLVLTGCVMTASAGTKTVFLDVTKSLSGGNSWASENATFAVFGNGSESNKITMTAVVGKTGYYYADVDDSYTKIVFHRLSSNGEGKWNNTQDITTYNNNALFKITDWGACDDGSSSIFSVTPTTNFQYGISGQSGWTSVTLSGSNGVLTGSVDLTNTFDDKNFGLNVTGDDFRNTGELTLEDPNSLVDNGASTGSDFTLKNSTKAYKTYSITATWLPNQPSGSNWILKVEGNAARGSQTYNLTVNNEAGWSNVKVYTFSPDLNQSGTWDSTDNMVTSDEGATWTYSKTFYEPYPTKVLFKDVNGNTSNKTDDLYLINNHTYSNDGTTKYYIIGDISEFGNFDPTQTTALMTATTDGESHPIHTYSIENLALSSGTVEYKILQRKYAEQVASMTYYPMGTENNKVITVSDDGKYNLSIQFNDYWDNKYDEGITSYTITRVTAPVSVGAKGYATYCNANHALDFTGNSIKAYTIACTDGSSLTLTAKDKVAKNEPVLLYSETANDSQDIPAIADGDASATAGNKLVAGDGVAHTWTDGAKHYILYTGNLKPKPGFYKANNNTVAVGKAYLDLTIVSTAREFFGFTDDETTGINAVENGNVEAKATVIYNMNGQRVANPTKGLYIVNGKKVIIK